MPCYQVELEFSIVHALYDRTDPKGTPEQIAAHTEGLKVTLMNEHQGIRTYCAVLTVEAASEGGLTDNLVGLFDHLPQYVPGSIRVDELEPKPGTVAAPIAANDARDKVETGPPSLDERQAAHAARIADDSVEKLFGVQCYFKSAVPFEVLKAGFVKHIAIGNLVSNSMMGEEYVAFVSLKATSSYGLEDIVEHLLAKAFDAETEESAFNFRPVKTTLIKRLLERT